MRDFIEANHNRVAVVGRRFGACAEPPIDMDGRIVASHDKAIRRISYLFHYLDKTAIDLANRIHVLENEQYFQI